MYDLLLNLDVSAVPANSRALGRKHAKDLRFMKGTKARERREHVRTQHQRWNNAEHGNKPSVTSTPESQAQSRLKKSRKAVTDTLGGGIAKHSSATLRGKAEKMKAHTRNALVQNTLLDEFSSGEARPHKQVTQDVPQILANKNPNRYLGLDCEMVGTGPFGVCNELARCSIVSYYGDVVYDRYVLPKNPITDYRTQWSGITAKHMTKAIPFYRAKKEIVHLLKDKVVVGHALHNDFKVLDMKVAQSLQRDTSHAKLLRSMAGLPIQRVTSLKILTKALLKEDIQVGTDGHSSVVDAWSAMQLFRLVQIDWEKELDGQASEKIHSMETQVTAVTSQKPVTCKVEGKVLFKPKVKNMMEKSNEELFKCLNVMLGKADESACETGKDIHGVGKETCIAGEEDEKCIKQCKKFGKTNDESLVNAIKKKRKQTLKVDGDHITANGKKPYRKNCDGIKPLVVEKHHSKDESAELARKKFKTKRQAKDEEVEPAKKKRKTEDQAKDEEAEPARKKLKTKEEANDKKVQPARTKFKTKHQAKDAANQQGSKRKRSHRQGLAGASQTALAV